MKHQEFIFAVPSSLFQDVEGFETKFSLEELIKKIHPHTIAAQRAGLENNPDFLQLLPYCNISDSDKYLLYQRTKQVGEERLGGKFSIGIGGHVDLIDYVGSEQPTTGELSLMSLLKRNIEREIQEETSTNCHITEQTLEDCFAGIIVDRGNDVGKVHIGLVFGFNIKDLLDDEEASGTLKITEPELLDFGYQTLESLKTYDTERWTKILIDHLESI